MQNQLNFIATTLRATTLVPPVRHSLHHLRTQARRTAPARPRHCIRGSHAQPPPPPPPRVKTAVSTALFRTTRSAETEVLLVRRANAPNKGLWALPGGSVHVGEPLPQAAARELQEETSIPPQAVRWQLNAVHVARVALRDAHVIYHIHVFAATLRSPAVQPLAASDAADARFFSMHSLRSLNTVPNIHAAISDAQAAIADAQARGQK